MLPRMAALAIVAAFLAGCGSPADTGGFYATGVVATAEFPLPIDLARLEEVARGLGWYNRSATLFEEGFHMELRDANETELVAQRRPGGPNWTLTRIYDIPGSLTRRYATSEEATNASQEAWPQFEPGFDALVSTFEEAGRWERIRVRTACLCAGNTPT